MKKNSIDDSGNERGHKKEDLLDKIDYNYRCELNFDNTFTIKTLPVQVRLQTQSSSFIYKFNNAKEDSDKYSFYKELLLQVKKSEKFNEDQFITKHFTQKGKTFSWIMHYTNPNRAQAYNSGCLKVLAHLASSGSDEITDEMKQIEGAGMLIEEILMGSIGIITADQAKAICSLISQNFECVDINVNGIKITTQSRKMHYTFFLKDTGYIGGYELKQRNISHDDIRLCFRGRRRYAMKLMTKNSKKYDLEELKRLLLIHNILALDVIDVMETETQIYSVMELVEGGSLATHLPPGGFDDVTAKFYMHQITQILYFYHCNNVFHKNLRLSNMILKGDGYNVKIGGFGLIQPSYADISSYSPSELAYVPPEFLRSDIDFSKVDYRAANVWSLGIILHEMITGVVPFISENARETAALIEAADFNPGKSDSEGLDLVKMILQKDPQARPSLTAVMQHPWMHVVKGDIRSPLVLKFTANCVYVQPQGTLCLLRKVLWESGIIFKDTTAPANYDYSALCFYAKAGIKFCVSFYREVNSAELGAPAQTNNANGKNNYVATSPPASIISMSKPIPLMQNGVFNGNRNPNYDGDDDSGSSSDSSSSGAGSRSGSELISKDMNLFFKIEFKSGDGSRFAETSRMIKDGILRKLQNSALVKTDVPIDRNVLLMTAAHLAEEFRVSFEQELHEKKATVLLLGKTGSGKSSVANRIFGTKIAEVGQGKPVTKHFTRHTMLGKPVVVYDSKGFEVNSANQFKAEMDAYFMECGDTVHVIWYVIDGTSSRFEPFEHEFLSSSPLGVPVIVLVNKADLCAPADIEALRAAVSSAEIPCVKGVIATVTAAETVDPPPERCPECGSDDISVLRKKLQWRCNGCDVLHSLKVTSSLHHGLVDVVSLTHSLVPDLVKEAFVASQTVSIRSKLKASLEVIRRLLLPQISINFLTQKHDNADVPLGDFIKALVKICTIWDVSLGNKSSNGEINENSNTFARQLLCTVLPLVQQNDMSDFKIGDECCVAVNPGEKPVEVALQPSIGQKLQQQQQMLTPPPQPPLVALDAGMGGEDDSDHDEFGNSERSESDSDDNLIEYGSDDEVKKTKIYDKQKQQELLQWRWNFIEKIIDVLGNSIQTVEDKDAANTTSGTPPDTNTSPGGVTSPTMSTPPTTAIGSARGYSTGSSPRRRAGQRPSPREISVVPPAPPPLPNPQGKVQAGQLGELGRRNSLDGKSSTSFKTQGQAPKTPLSSTTEIKYDGECHGSSSSSCTPREDNLPNGNADGEHSHEGNSSSDGASKEDDISEEMDDEDESKVLNRTEERRFFLIHAIAIAWTQSLLSFHLLLLDYGYDANNPACRKSDDKKFEPMLKGCVERAFAYFNVKVISQVEAMLEKERESSEPISEDGMLKYISTSSNSVITDKRESEGKIRSLDDIIGRVFSKSIHEVMKSLEKILKFSPYKSDSFLLEELQLLQSPILERLQPQTAATDININK